MASPKKKTTDTNTATPAAAPAEAAAAAEPLMPTVDADGFIGELSEQAKLALGTIQRQQGECLTQMGSIELRKNQILGQHQHLQAQAKRILDDEALRLGIPNGKAWQVTPDGKARLVA
jgi:hypothetical protein